jgi:hypothetical protein
MGKIHDHSARKISLRLPWALSADGEPTARAAHATNGRIAPSSDATGYDLGIGIEAGTFQTEAIARNGGVAFAIDAPSKPLSRLSSDTVRPSQPLDRDRPIAARADVACPRHAKAVADEYAITARNSDERTAFSDLESPLVKGHRQ